jgi:hypothetical protein
VGRSFPAAGGQTATRLGGSVSGGSSAQGRPKRSVEKAGLILPAHPP